MAYLLNCHTEMSGSIYKVLNLIKVRRCCVYHPLVASCLIYGRTECNINDGLWGAVVCSCFAFFACRIFK